MYMNWAAVGGRKSDETGATAAALLGGRATKQKLQLYKERCSMGGGCHGERRELEKIFHFPFPSPLVQATHVT